MLQIVGGIIAFIIAIYGFKSVSGKVNGPFQFLVVLTVANATYYTSEMPGMSLIVLFLFWLIIVHSKKSCYQLEHCTVYVLFLIWVLFGLMFTTNVIKGLLMFLKYFLPLIFYIVFSITFIQEESIIKYFDKIVKFTPLYLLLGVLGAITGNFFIANPYFTMNIFAIPVVLYLSRNHSKKYLFLMFLFLIPPILLTKRTPLLGIGLSVILLLVLNKGLKALFSVIAVLALSITIVFYIPEFRNKIFFNADTITLSDLKDLAEISEQVNTNGRSYFWGQLIDNVYKNNEIMGAGTGAVKDYIQSPRNPDRDSFLLVHNDFLLLLCENGLIGIALFSLFLITIIFRIIKHSKSKVPIVKNMSYGMLVMLVTIICHLYFENCLNTFNFCVFFAFYALFIRVIKLHKRNHSVQVSLA
jgi:O-antigen ligase